MEVLLLLNAKLFFSPWRDSPVLGQGLLIIEASRLHLITLCTSDQPDAKPST